ncbi:MAG: amidohydrolase [Pirellulaceae bacterium]|nr:amidohydrolase [Pirellulaceae bacterium]
MHKVLCLTVLLFSLLVLPRAQAGDPATWVNANMESLVKLYIHFHENPELSFQEEKTSQRFAEELEKIGCQVTQNFGGYGVVGIMENGAGPVVMLRADLDGLPVTERTGRPYASQIQVEGESGGMVGVMHACGHDIHMTNLLGTAQYLAAHKDQWQGTLMLIGQPAEERGSGAVAMIDAGLFEKFKKPDVCLAIHCAAGIPSGKIALRGGFMMANVDSVDVTFYGRGGHGAYPHTTVDPIVEAAKFVLDVQTMVSREIKPTEPAVITVGSIHAGTKHNIIPDDCHLQLTVRSYADDVRVKLLEGIKRKARAAALSVGAKEPLIKVSEGTPSLANDEDLVARLNPVFKKALADKDVLVADQVMGGEDFSQFGRQGGMPTLLFWVGAVNQDRLSRYGKMGLPIPSLHSAEFYPDTEPVLTTGITAMASAVLDLMPRQ